MMKKNLKVDAFLREETKWQKEMMALRAIALGSGLTEELKWGQPCYTFEGKNIVLIHGFKDYCALLFMKGALLKDPKKILIQQTENVQAGRQIRFTNLADIKKLEPNLKAYIQQAIEVEKSGMKIIKKKTEDYPIPREFRQKLHDDPALQRAFEALTPGRQRGYLLYFAAAKQSKTREERIEKCIGKILDGIGLQDQYM